MSVSVQRQFCVAVSLILFGLAAVIGAAIVLLCDGHLSYYLDDPYVTLALSQQIAHGNYGINPGEVSSPSSSILYPFVLAAFAWSQWQELVPAMLNTIACVATGAVLATELYRIGIVTRREDLPRGTLLIVTLCVAVNAVGLIFTGLEHSFHMLTSVLVLIGLARVFDGEELPKWLVIAIVLLPLWRFEGLALAGLAIFALAVVRQQRAAAAAAVGIGVTLGMYFFAMSRLGLPLLPSSVLVKSDFANDAVSGSLGITTFFRMMRHHIADGLRLKESWPVFILLGIVTAHGLLRLFSESFRLKSRQLSQRHEALMAIVVCGALIAHILFGSWGWFSRYEDYAMAIGATGAVLIWRREIAILIHGGSTVAIAGAVAVLASLGIVYVATTAFAPRISQYMFEEHYQLHRFVVDYYKRPVAVNDIGWIKYRNPYYVFDLWGLGSEVARKARTAPGVDAGWLRRLMESRPDIGLVIIYDDFFPGQIPTTWRRIGTLESRLGCWLNGWYKTVSIYTTSKQDEAYALDTLRAFSRTTPVNTLVRIFGS